MKCVWKFDVSSAVDCGSVLLVQGLYFSCQSWEGAASRTTYYQLWGKTNAGFYFVLPAMVGFGDRGTKSCSYRR